MSILHPRLQVTRSEQLQRIHNRNPLPLLRWAGSKRKLLSHLERAAPQRFRRYIEPFFGSGCLFFRLQPKASIISDLNRDVVGFYDAIRKQPVDVLEYAKVFLPTRESYYWVRKSFLQEQDPFRRAAKFFFLNRYCFNGIYRTNKKGEFNVPFGTKTGDLPNLPTVMKSAALLKRAKLLSGDFERAVSLAKTDDFVYLDPPYVYKTRKDRGEYGLGSFNVCDLSRLTDCLNKLNEKGARFLLSYLECKEIEDVTKRFNTISVPVSRTVASIKSARTIVNEVLIKNY